MTGRPLPRAAARATATARSGSSSSAAPAPVLQTFGTGQPMLMSIRSAPAAATRSAADAITSGSAPNSWTDDWVLVGVDPQQLSAGPLVAVVHSEARDHLRHRQPGAVALGLQSHEPVADPGQRRQHHAVGDLNAAERPRLGKRLRCSVGSELRVRTLITRSWYESAHGHRRVLEPWMQIIRDQVPGLELFDAHTHLGEHDPDGMHDRAPTELLATAARGRRPRLLCVPDARARAAIRAANDMVIAVAAQADGLFGAVLPRRPPRSRRSRKPSARSRAGARGIKLHPRAEQFTLDHPAVRNRCSRWRTSARCRS